jgi:hypothetical protein
LPTHRTRFTNAIATMKTEIYLSKEFLQHINNTVQPLPGNEIVIMVSENRLKVFNKDAAGEYILAIYNPQIPIKYVADTLPPAPAGNGTNTNNHTTDY